MNVPLPASIVPQKQANDPYPRGDDDLFFLAFTTEFNKKFICAPLNIFSAPSQSRYSGDGPAVLSRSEFA